MAPSVRGVSRWGRREKDRRRCSHARTHPRLFAEAFGARDLEAALALYEPGATLIPLPGQVVTGTEAIREALGATLALGPRFDLEFNKAFEAGDLALLFSDWTLSTTDPDGNAVELAGRASDVAVASPTGIGSS
jgi:ketosteroid isomerase-like protein